jgi:hypothetical protein
MPREAPVTITTRPEYELITRRYLARAAKFRRDYKHGALDAEARLRRGCHR